ncbi:LysR family transcriptional regulator [Aestuariibacter halophilus]|uniref:LysR family transcriptional regulator n=1 Tax=Fluctibacter halophilus TaxID=226011 RepID=A0ABS8G696_9ALTE|nr:LysR family transcriptional regulator [Aestuariibacter halophilus]MCC2616043.1 LysR family transcriptional regulator [Aestuariibacter halophilus]
MASREGDFDWNHAQAFWVTAKAGSFSAAARQLSLTQPTLGRKITQLEQALGVTLFERSSRGLRLTADGNALFAHVDGMQQSARALALAAGGRSERLEGHVSISATEVAAAFELPPIIAALRQHAPGITVEVIASNASSDLLSREADLALRAYRPTQPELIARKIGDFRAHLYAGREYLKQHPVRSIDDLTDCDFLAFDHSDLLIDALNERRCAVTRDNFPVVVESHLVQWEMVKHGVGIGFMTEAIGDREPSVVRVLQDMPAFETELWLVVHRELHTSRRLRLVMDFLAEALMDQQT